jgi:hypothetical protein
MAKHVILESYTFNPTTRTIVVTGKNIRKEQLLLITNVTRNTVIYNFSDPNLNSSSYTNSSSNVGFLPTESTTIILSYNTTAMSSTDKLAILVEETYTEIMPAETLLDPVGKMRVSEPQALIDTDFEYGIQPTKWETINLLTNRPSAFYDASRAATGLSNITVSGQTVRVLLTDTSQIANNQPIFVQGTLDAGNVDGWWLATNVIPNSSVEYATPNIPVMLNGNIFDGTKTYLFGAAFYSNAGITVNNVTISSSVMTVSTTNPHGFFPGDGFYLANTIGVNANASYIVSTTPTANTFTSNVAGVLAATSGTLANPPFDRNLLYPRALGYTEHRPFDGGVQFTNGNPAHGYQLIRQTRRYFRYQSGKGIQFSTGSIMKPAYALDNMTSSGTTVTVTTKYIHGLLPGASVIVSGADQSAYNGTFVVTATLNPTTFQFTAGSTPAASPATGFPIFVSPASWTGSRSRLGLFDEQNGFFFEFDGQTLWAVKRSSTFQISGSVSVTQGSGLVTGTSTKFSTQLAPGDRIVIRGQSYLIETILSDTQLYVLPEYRGATAQNCLVSKTIDTKYAQSTWNIDRCDGTGHSLYNLDLTRMQMFYIDYSWYGAGAVRFGFKNTRGEVIYCHRIANNNVNTEAYMRSGNMCARYETNTIPPYTYLTSTLSSAATTGATVSVADTSLFGNTGAIMVQASGIANSPIEIISYTAKTANTFTIGSRAVYGGVTSANTFTYSATAPIQVSWYGQQAASTLSHWGSSVIMDGKYDDDKSLVFNIGQNNPLVNLPPNTRYALLSLRSAPSVDNGFTGLLGQREIVNRMQLVMRQMDALTTAPYRIDVILNGTPSQGFWQNVGGSSLAQYVLHANATTILGGENMFSFFTQSTGQTQQDMSLARDLGTSILGGGLSNQANTLLNKYPDGPDMVTICATALSNTGNINARISWTEAQA